MAPRLKLFILALTSTGFLLAGCDTPPKVYSPSEILEICEKKRNEADGVTGGVNFGVNSRSGPFVSATIGVNDKITENLDPDKVYRDCIEIHQNHNIAARNEIAARAAAKQ